MKKYRVLVDMIEHGYVDVEAKNEAEAKEKAFGALDDGAFVGNNSHEIGRAHV